MNGRFSLAAAPLACLALLAALLLPCAGALAADTIKIGAVLSVTGPAAFLGEPEKNTMLMVQDAVNAAGGVLGKKIEVIVYDDESDVNKAVLAAQKLIKKDRVVAVAGPSTSGNSLGIMKFFEESKVPLISCAASEKIVNPVGKWVFSVAPLDRYAAGKIIADAKKKGMKKLALLSVSDGFGQSGRAVVQELVPAQGLSLVADEVYGPKDTDMTAQLTKIKEAAPDAIVVWGTNPGPAVIARNREQLALASPLYVCHGVASKKFIELAGPSAEGLLLPAGRIIVAAQLPDSDPQKKLLMDYTTKYQEKYNAPVSTFGGHGWDSVSLIVKAMDMAKSDKPEAIRDALEKISAFPGTAGIFTYTPTNHNGLDEGAFLMIKVEKGDWKIVE
jgi:branched-chain amino acid transport system substrate-binding protein